MMTRKTSKLFLCSILCVIACAVNLLVGSIALAKGTPTLSMSNVTAQPGTTTSLGVRITNNPGIVGATLRLTYGSGLTLTDIVNGEAFSALDMTKPGKLQSGCCVHWDVADLDDGDVKDGVICTLKFSVASGTTGSKKISIAAVTTDGLSDVIDRDLNYVNLAGASCTVEIGSSSNSDGWVTLSGGKKGYRKNGKLVTGWLDLGTSKYWFGSDNTMATGWTDVLVSGKTMHYYFNPSSGNLARGTWMTIDAKKYYFRESGNVAHGWATISDNGVDKKYYFGDDYQMVTGWREIEVNGKLMRYYFRPAGSMATGWATIDGEKYFFRASGNMATGFTTVDDAYKRYFDESGHMLVGWQTIGGKTYYFRSSGAMQTGKATIDGKVYEFTTSGTLKSTVSAQSDDEAIDLI